MGIDRKRLGWRSSARDLLFRLHVDCSGMGLAQSFPHSKAIRLDAQEPSLHSLFRSVGSQQMGIPLRSVPRDRILFHHADIGLHPGQVNLRCVCSEQRHCPSYRFGGS